MFINKSNHKGGRDSNLSSKADEESFILKKSTAKKGSESNRQLS
jgi:hypothetical protein